jgi:hypothetical protein
MAALKEQVKIFIIQRLACFDSPTEVAEAVKEELNIELKRSHVSLYDPTSVNGEALSQKFKDVFFETREKFLEEVGKIPIASQAYRVRALQRSYDFFKQRKNYIAANGVLEQAAKEVGGFYTNKVKLADADGNAFIKMMEGFAGGSMPIVSEVEGDYVRVNEPKEVKEVKQLTMAPKAPKKAQWNPK